MTNVYKFFQIVYIIHMENTITERQKNFQLIKNETGKNPDKLDRALVEARLAVQAVGDPTTMTPGKVKRMREALKRLGNVDRTNARAKSFGKVKSQSQIDKENDEIKKSVKNLFREN